MASKAIISGQAKQLIYSNFGKQPIRLKGGEKIGKATPLQADDFCKDAKESFVLETEMPRRSEDLADFVCPDNSSVSKSELRLGDVPEFPCYTAEVNLPEKIDSSRPTIAILPEGQDRQALPTGPTYKQFDIALNEHGEPHPEIIKVIEENIEAFALDGKPGRVKDGTQLSLKTDDTKLVPEPARRVGPEKAQVIRDTVQQLLDWNVIEKSNSKVSYPVLLVLQNKKWRFCID